MKGKPKNTASFGAAWYENRLRNVYGVLSQRSEPYEAECSAEAEQFISELRALYTEPLEQVQPQPVKLKKAC